MESRPEIGSRGVGLGRIHGIEIRLDLSVAIIFFLVIYSLGSGLFPQWHPEWSSASIWLTAIAAGVLFFASLLAHELAHSLVAQRYGIPVPRITLFVFGGVSELGREPASPRAELHIAIVGPLMSFAIALTCGVIGAYLAGPTFLDALRADPEAAIGGLGAGATLLLWLGPINAMLAVFNLVPGFPLDGGRVLRAALWWLGGDLRRATEWASRAGRGFAWALMALGVLQALGGAVVPGLWLLLIGWFLNNAARGSYLQLLLTQTMESVRVRDLMRTRYETVEADAPLKEFIDRKLLRSDQIAWPVLRQGRPIGLIGLDSIRAVLDQEREPQTVAEATQPIDETIGPDEQGRDALRLLGRVRQDPIPVLDGGDIVGLLFHADLMRWLVLHRDDHR
jgi:Zn-dependent protease